MGDPAGGGEHGGAALRRFDFSLPHVVIPEIAQRLSGTHQLHLQGCWAAAFALRLMGPGQGLRPFRDDGVDGP